MSNAVHNIGTGTVQVFAREWSHKDGPHSELAIFVHDGLQLRIECSKTGTTLRIWNPHAYKSQEIQLK